MNRILTTKGQGTFEQSEYVCPAITTTQIKVKSLMTGICRSDVDMMTGSFGLLPDYMQGHEGLGQVIEVGTQLNTSVKIGDVVATRGEPAYADFYNVEQQQFVVVPEVHPRYILEPVACGINVVQQALENLVDKQGSGKRLLILGSGFLAYVSYCTIKIHNLQFNIDVVGNYNKDIWPIELLSDPEGKYDVVIDLSSRLDVFDKDILNNQALIILANQKNVTTDFGNLLWKACQIIFPSPRTDKFYSAMQDAAFWVKQGRINVDKFWTRGYNRDIEWQQAFKDSLIRDPKYNRGYIYW